MGSNIKFFNTKTLSSETLQIVTNSCSCTWIFAELWDWPVLISTTSLLLGHSASICLSTFAFMSPQMKYITISVAMLVVKFTQLIILCLISLQSFLNRFKPSLDVWDMFYALLPFLSKCGEFITYFTIHHHGKRYTLTCSVYSAKFCKHCHIISSNWLTIYAIQAIKDWHLAVAVGVLVGIIAVMVTLSAAVPPLQPDIELSEDQGKSHGRTVWQIIDITPR